jgi:hypothetical protein
LASELAVGARSREDGRAPVFLLRAESTVELGVPDDERVPSEPTRKKLLRVPMDDVRVPTDEPAMDELRVRAEDAVDLEDAVDAGAGPNADGMGERARPAAVLRVLATLRMDGGRRPLPVLALVPVLGASGIAGGAGGGPMLPCFTPADLPAVEELAVAAAGAAFGAAAEAFFPPPHTPCTSLAAPAKNPNRPLDAAGLGFTTTEKNTQSVLNA